MNAVSLCHAIWRPFVDTDGRAQQIVQQNHLSPLLASCLARLEPPLNPGPDVDAFLAPSMSQYHDPFLMLHMDKAVQRLQRAIQNHENIRIVTDYDVDGTMSSLIMQATLHILGHTQISYHIPHRKIEGYGFSLQAAQAAVQDKISLIITADIGVRDETAIAYAQAHDIDVLVFDHHLPEGTGIPKSAFTVVCPPQDGCHYPNPHLAACGISLKLAQALLHAHPKCQDFIRSMSKLAALGTVADVVSLRDQENRAIVATGLHAINHDPNAPGLAALLSVSKIEPGCVDAAKIGFSLGPKINAAGRMASANHVIELMNSQNRVKAQGLADQLSMMNDERKNVQEFMVQTALNAIKDQNSPFLFVALPESDTWQSGIAGIVAGRLREQTNKTVAIGTLCGDDIVASMRSATHVHAVHALDAVAKHLEKYGGHKAAAGFTFKVQHLQDVITGIQNDIAKQLEGIPEIQEELFIAAMNPDELSIETFNELQRLEPCGSKNPKPAICLTHVSVKFAKLCKNNSIRTIIRAKDCDLITWIPSYIPITTTQLTQQPVSLLGTLELDHYDGIQYTMRVKDVCLESRDDLG